MKPNTPLLYWLIGFSGILVSFYLFYLINDRKIQQNAQLVENSISQAETKLKVELQKIQLVVQSMSFFIENNTELSQEEFEQLTLPFKKNLSGIRALFYSSAQNINLIFDEESLEVKAPLVKDSLGNSYSYFPIKLITPLEQLRGVLGYDIYSEQNRRDAINQSFKSKKITVTAPLKLISDNNGVPGILAVKVVTDRETQKIKGIVSVVYRMDDFLGNTLKEEMKFIDIIIKDKEAANSLLFSSLSTIPTKTSSEKFISLSAVNRIWNIHFYPKIERTEFPHSLESYFILIMGLTSTVLLLSNLKVRDTRRQNLETKVKIRTKELEVSNKQKENLLREVHHRVMNNLQITSSLMNLQKRKLHDEDAINALSSSQDRIKAIALIHKNIYQHEGIDAVNLKEYLENLIKTHKQLSPEVKYSIKCPSIFIDLDTAVPLAIITSEIVVNALKHAFYPDAELKLLNILVHPVENKTIALEISDNGKGIPKKMNVSKGTGLGFDIIKKLCRQLQATYEYSSNSSGTTFSLKFQQRKLNIPNFEEAK
ncbi:MAG: histidine kinase dimerization/phosphoacceptor domain -containing protein [Maribacter sp.]